ncbi:MAG: NUDIX domain-containing protein [Chitinophagales bacterium]|nr:NUDIX domain-containing protein [Chitinophagales bacterium]
MDIQRFNIRVYGLLLHKGNLLVIDELILGQNTTKFPGGGLEFGEGTHDCLKREMREEASIEVSIASHFYTTDFFQQSAFNKADQLLSIYYTIKSTDLHLLDAAQEPYDFKHGATHRFRWIRLDKLSPALFTFPIDQIVVKMLLERTFTDLYF